MPQDFSKLKKKKTESKITKKYHNQLKNMSI